MSDEARATRRQVVQAVVVAGVAGPVLVACGGGDGGRSGDNGAAGPAIRCGCHGSRYSITDGSVINGPATRPLAAVTIAITGDEITYEGKDLAAEADIPVGGGTVFKAEKVVVTQPESGRFQAFTAVCTHQGCIVKEVDA
jgi:Rieske Fe-S protein